MSRSVLGALLLAAFAAASVRLHAFGPIYYVSLNTLDDSWVSSTCVNTPGYPPLTATGTSAGANELFTIEDLNEIGRAHV